MIKWQLVLFLCIAPAPLDAAWKPPEKPDPQLILREAQSDAGSGRFEDALAKYVWFHQHALKYRRSLYGVRLSFALNYWHDLGMAYPPALAKFKSMRDAALQDALNGKNLRESFHDLTAMDHTLGEPEQTKDAFVALAAKYPGQMKELYDLAQAELVAAKAYALCDKYLEPKTSLPKIIERYHQSVAMAKDPKFGESMEKFAQDQFESQSATLIALLVLNHRQDEAETVARDARKEWGDKQFHATIDKALKGELPTPWP